MDPYYFAPKGLYSMCTQKAHTENFGENSVKIRPIPLEYPTWHPALCAFVCTYCKNILGRAYIGIFLHRNRICMMLTPLTKKSATKPRKSTILGHFLKEFRDKGFLTQFWLLQAGPIFGRAYLRKYWELANDI